MIGWWCEPCAAGSARPARETAPALLPPELVLGIQAAAHNSPVIPSCPALNPSLISAPARSRPGLQRRCSKCINCPFLTQATRLFDEYSGGELCCSNCATDRSLTAELKMPDLSPLPTPQQYYAQISLLRQCTTVLLSRSYTAYCFPSVQWTASQAGRPAPRRCNPYTARLLPDVPRPDPRGRGRATAQIH